MGCKKRRGKPRLVPRASTLDRLPDGLPVRIEPLEVEGLRFRGLDREGDGREAVEAERVPLDAGRVAV